LKTWMRTRSMPLKEMEIQTVHKLHEDGKHCSREGMGERVS
jgi:hypothetical protein